MCAGERFTDQPAGSFCPVALVGPDLMLTAGHCLLSVEICGRKKLSLGYEAYFVRQENDRLRGVMER